MKSVVNNVEEYLASQDKWKFPRKEENPMHTVYCPGLYAFSLLEPRQYVYYMSLVGILRWMVEIGRVDICLDVS